MEDFGFFSEQLAISMATKRITAKALAPKVGCSYEHVRRMQLGKGLPSLPLLRRLCGVFGWSERKLHKFVILDRARREFGKNFWEVQGMDSRGDGVYILWVFLTNEEREYWIEWLRFVAARHQEKIPKERPDPSPVAETT